MGDRSDDDESDDTSSSSSNVLLVIVLMLSLGAIGAVIYVYTQLASRVISETALWKATFTGGGQSVTVNITLVRTGNQVTAHIPTFATSGALSADAVLVSGAIPSDFANTDGPYSYAMTFSGSSKIIGNITSSKLSSGVVLVIAFGPANGNLFPSGATAGIASSIYTSLII